MRAVMREVPQEWLDERRRLGHDLLDEVWDGVLHLVPQPGTDHQRLGARLLPILQSLAATRGLEVFYETSVFRTADMRDYRAPDLVVVDPAHVSARGVEACAAIVIEILSPDDDSHLKLPFYGQCGIDEVWFVDPRSRSIEVRVLRDGSYVAVVPDRDGWLRAPRLGVQLQTIDGPKLAITWADGSTEI